jgi:teichuronic acid biosynthesis glycosyltransferase TuaC
LLSGSKKENAAPVKDARTVLQVISVPEIAFKFSQPRVTREIDAMLETGRYSPVVVSTEKVLVHEIKQIFKTKSFEDPRVKIYMVPNLVEKPLQEYGQSNLLNRLSYVIFNALSQFLYLLFMMFTLLIATIKENAVIIHVHNPPDLAGVAALVVSKFTGIPYVFEIHDSTPVLYTENMGLSQNSLMYKFLRLQENVVIKNSSAIIVTSNFMLTHYPEVNVPKIVIYSGWKAQADNLSETSKHNLRSEYGLVDKHIILYEGKMFCRIYDLDLSLRGLAYVIKQHPDSILVFVGDGEDKPHLEHLAREMELEANVRFIGVVPRSKLFEWINTSDIAILTLGDSSLQAKQGNVPNKLLEYMAFGKPIVAPRLNGISEVIENGENGLLYIPGSSEDFARCVLSLIDDSELRSKFQHNAKQDFVSKYSYEKNMPKLISLYDVINL